MVLKLMAAVVASCHGRSFLTPVLVCGWREPAPELDFPFSEWLPGHRCAVFPSPPAPLRFQKGPRQRLGPPGPSAPLATQQGILLGRPEQARAADLGPAAYVGAPAELGRQQLGGLVQPEELVEVALVVPERLGGPLQGGQ